MRTSGRQYCPLTNSNMADGFQVVGSVQTRNSVIGTFQVETAVDLVDRHRERERDGNFKAIRSVQVFNFLPLGLFYN
ncbi:hypothetical protein V6N13_118277 [Hibiscus sabdariffa]